MNRPPMTRPVPPLMGSDMPARSARKLGSPEMRRGEGLQGQATPGARIVRFSNMRLRLVHAFKTPFLSLVAPMALTILPEFSAWGQSPDNSPVSNSPDPVSQDLPVEMWGPQPGEVRWSKDGLFWNTPQLSLHLHPWFTVRSVTGTPSFASESALAAPWDNLRGAAFSGTLDGRWTIQGSLEEMQAIPDIHQLFWMGDWSNAGYWTSLPGWGQAKVTSQGRMDVARARVTTEHIRPISRGDTLTFRLSYNAASWGEGPHRLLLDPDGPSFPHAGIQYQRQHVTLSGTAARWVGSERGPIGGTTESLFRRSDAGWLSLKGSWPSGWSAGCLAGGSRLKPWSREDLSDSLEGWQPMVSAYVMRSLGKHQIRGEWQPTYAWTVSWTWRSLHEWVLNGWMTHVLDVGPSSIQNMGVPLGTPLVPMWWDASQHSITWIGMSSTWTRGPWHAQVVAQFAGQNALVEASAGRELLDTWPLSLVLALESWTWETHPIAPLQGTRLRAGVTHTWRK